jgi:type IX secretion system PorP/SprF family membrane protein
MMTLNTGRMNMKTKIWMILISVMTASASKAQDLHFSQYFNAPLLVNPANTGFMPEGDYRVGINYRNQWANVGNPYKTFSAYGDVQLLGDRFDNGWVGLGGALLRDVAGTGNLTSTKAFASVAYHQAVGFGSLFSAGFNVGYVNKKVDFTKLTFDNQWNGRFFDINVSPGEPILTNQVDYFTLQAGMNYAYFPTDDVYVNVGVSASNLNQPHEPFISGDSNRVKARYTAFLNASFRAGEAWIINPNLYYSQMGSATEVVGGMMAQRNLSGDGNTQLLAGLYYRVSDAVIPVVGFQQNGYKFTFSYDATTSGLRPFNGMRGGYELSVVKQGLFNQSSGIKCPGVRF